MWGTNYLAGYLRFSQRGPVCLCHISLTFENLCEHEENCLISTVKSSSFVSSSSSVSIWWYFSDRAAEKCLGTVPVTPNFSFSFRYFNYEFLYQSNITFRDSDWKVLSKAEMIFYKVKAKQFFFMSDNALTIKITCVIFGFQLGNKFCLLSQQTVPV